MKKISILILVFLIALAFVNAIGFSTILMVGNQLGLQVPGEFQETINTIVCASDPISCAEGKIVGEFKSEIYNTLPPDVKEAYDTYGQIQGYYAKFQQTVNTINELSVDKDGIIKDGKIEVGEGADKKTFEFRGIKPKHDEETGHMIYTFSEENSIITINERYSYTNVKPADEKTGTNSYLKFDENNNLIEADLTTNERGSIFVFGDKKIDVPANTQVTYDGDNIVIYGEAGKKADVNFLSGFDPEQSQIPSKYMIEYGKSGTVVFTGTGLEISSGVKVTDKDLGFSVTNTAASNLFLTDDEKNIGLYDNWIVANKNLVKYDTTSTLELLPGNNWMKDVNKDNKMLLALNGEGSIYNNELHIASGQVISLTSSKDCNSEITYTTKDIILGKENDVSCIAMSALSEEGNYVYNADEDGSGNLQICEQQPMKKATANMIIEKITGRFMQWITGGQVLKAGLVCTNYLIQNAPSEEICSSGECKFIGKQDGDKGCCYLNSVINHYCTGDSYKIYKNICDEIEENEYEKLEEKPKEACSLFKDPPDQCAIDLNCKDMGSNYYCDQSDCTCKKKILPREIAIPRMPLNDPVFEGKSKELDYSCLPNIDNTIVQCRKGFFSPGTIGGFYDSLFGIPKFEFYRQLDKENNVWIWKLKSDNKIINCDVVAIEKLTHDNICYIAIFGKE